MQKKPLPSSESNSNWQDNLKKEARKQMMQKLAIWGGIILVCIAGLGLLVKLAGTTGTETNSTAVFENLPKEKPEDIVLGDKNAPVTITEYADFQCPACAAYNPITNQLLEEYKGKVKIVYRHFPLRNAHKNAIIAGQAAQAAHELGKFSGMKDLLFENQADWQTEDDPRGIFEGYAKSLGLDVARFREIMNSDEAKKAVEDGEVEAIGLGLNSTPTFFVGNKRIQPSGIDGFKVMIDEELK
jgi:protein-disulfide isomerase